MTGKTLAACWVAFLEATLRPLVCACRRFVRFYGALMRADAYVEQHLSGDRLNATERRILAASCRRAK